ncbi:pyrimidine dimer DNA glycosylase/endonuclease V [Promicromonospora iranensis]|uniref:pyrimidine dimer DNA glycosylase/endonuclease V n=1 Tax=Promicromonospora iranensis TaxID=1105144 RepID=UPI0023A9BC80|nr:pyrimidine dimer DNA glycosylase/endonuclease V [Promicromonospora iranensis]
MRLWSLDPAMLDRQGLIACWREALLAQAVLLGRTKGYTQHPQLERFREHPQPAVAISAYLHGLRDEATRRGYKFDPQRISQPLDEHTGSAARIAVTAGQLDLEWQHLLHKLAVRSPVHRADVVSTEPPSPHPLFVVVPGPVASWERAS